MQKNDTKTAIYNAAYELFSRHGFRRISVQDICQKANISRKTFYCYYDNKMSLVREILDTISKSTSEKYQQIMISQAPFSDKLIGILNLRMNALREISLDFMEDIIKSADSELEGYFQKEMDQNKNMILNFYRKAKRAGEIRNDISLSTIIQVQNLFLELCKSDTFRARFKDAASMMQQVSELYLFGITSRK